MLANLESFCKMYDLCQLLQLEMRATLNAGKYLCRDENRGRGKQPRRSKLQAGVEASVVSQPMMNDVNGFREKFIRQVLDSLMFVYESKHIQYFVNMCIKDE